MEKETIKKYGILIGFGRIMQLAQECWREWLQEQNLPAGGELAIGPAVALTVPCGCKKPSKCAWCCGSGWLTKKVKEQKKKAA